jgi:hypothetical protein
MSAKTHAPASTRAITGAPLGADATASAGLAGATASAPAVGPVAAATEQTGDQVSTPPVDLPAAVNVRALTVFHSIHNGAASGVTVTPGDEFETTAAHADELIRQGFAEIV